jgi:hypothetical protein
MLAKERTEKSTLMTMSVIATRRIRNRGIPISRAVFAFMVVASIVALKTHWGQPAFAEEPRSPERMSEVSAASTTGLFLVSSSIPLELPSSSLPSSSLLGPSPFEPMRVSRSLGADDIAQLAMSRSGTAQIVESDLQSRSNSSGKAQHHDNNYVMNRVQRAIAYRSRQVSRSNALKLHFAIAACARAEQAFEAADQMLTEQSVAQNKLVDAGIPISDPLFIDRARLAIVDKRVANRSQLYQLRAQLASFIGADVACNHSPSEEEAIIPSDSDVCEHIQQALRCRCDLATLIDLQSHVSADNLAQWDSIGAALSGVPLPVRGAVPFWLRLFRSTCNKDEQAKLVAARKKWLCHLIAERTKQITVEVELAFEKKKTAALRWTLESENQTNWDLRLRQLEAISEARGNLAEQITAKLNQFESKGKLIERWLEWHQANVELKLAVGCE